MGNVNNSNRKYYFKKRILKFKSNNGLVSEEDLINLFMGIYRLMKKNIQIELESKYIKKIKYLENQLHNTK